MELGRSITKVEEYRKFGPWGLWEYYVLVILVVPMAVPVDMSFGVEDS